MKKVISIILLCVLTLTMATSFVACGEKSAHPHPIIVVEETKATCGANGNVEHYHCEYCLKYFTDKEGKNEVKRGSVLIPATGEHIPGKDELYDLDGKWFHNQKCVKCLVAVNVDPVFCAVCGGQNLTRIAGNNFKCNEKTCAGKDGFTI